jgi:hypothetical protein
MGLIGAALGSVVPLSSSAAAGTVPNPAPIEARGAVPPGRKAPSGKQQLTPFASTTAVGGRPSAERIVDDLSKPLDWALWADADGMVGVTRYEDNPALGFSIPATWGLITWIRDRSFADADVRAVAMVAKKSEDYSVGVFCRGQGKARYEFLAGNFGSYSIWKADANGKYTNLTPGGKWTATDAVAKGFESLEVAARCRGDRLTLLIEGKEIVTITDRSITGSGSVGLVTTNYDEKAPLRIFFDDVEVRL